ncbi:LysM peptidoglycan-binding domain-containing protein [Limosilactobacillus panis]|uniref:LysM domain-containing protein n=1 Tax=Limosilactobacillus panis DSM 6035 TaxID=1423782 RepID=A0A0R1XI28_9LACO|nr:LysM domain-containing protein [Limosilactobacillus panis]KRM29838.1 hypothetical protein FD32_GL001048 [Limosilactobacillus panis DSM 6035]
MSSYDRVAWCTELSPTDHEYFKKMKDDGIDTAVICLKVAGAPATISGMHQTYAARAAGMIVHACCVTDLVDPQLDAINFAGRLNGLRYPAETRLAIMPLPDPRMGDPEPLIWEFIKELQEYRPNADIDICVTKEQIFNAEIMLCLLPAGINLTVANPGGLNAGVKEAGTWIYTSTYNGQPQLLAYDLYQYYSRPTSRGVQLSLDNEHEAREGDTWWIIAKQYDVGILDLLALNKANISDRIIPGQRIRVA